MGGAEAVIQKLSFLKKLSFYLHSQAPASLPLS